MYPHAVKSYRNERRGFIDCSGKTVIEARFPFVTHSPVAGHRSKSEISSKRKWGVIDEDGNWVIDPKFLWAPDIVAYNPVHYRYGKGPAMTDSPLALGKNAEPPPNEARLESWREVASYLRRDIRTVQRWEKDAGLPVRRLMIGKQGQVYAYRSELDKWMLERQPKAEGEENSRPADSPETGANVVPRPELSETKRKEPLLASWKWLAAGFALIMAGILIYRLGRMPNHCG